MPGMDQFLINGVNGESRADPGDTAPPDSFVFRPESGEPTAGQRFDPYKEFHFQVDTGGTETDSAEMDLPLPTDIADVFFHDQPEF